MFKRAFSVLSSLRLTVVCLTMAMVLVFAGTLAQVNLGLWDAQRIYFQSAFVYWTPAGGSLKIPVWPGGYLLGWVLLINLLSAHAVRFKFTRKKTGIFFTHVGLILLLLGQFFTELFQVESSIRLEEGESKNYSEGTRQNELAIVDVTDPAVDAVVVFPESALAAKGELSHPDLPFRIRVREYFPSSLPELVAPVAKPDGLRATQGVGQRLSFGETEFKRTMDSMNLPAALLEVVGVKGVEHSWMVSTWLTIRPFLGRIMEMENWRPMLGDLPAQPQQFTFNERTYQIALRPTRYYKFASGGPTPYRIELIDFRHDRYVGTGVAKNFSSLVRVKSFSETGAVIEDREVTIKMNQPLRYGGETYYQGSFEPDNERVTILHVVRNPAWLTPYLACTLVGLGLIVQFLMHLVGFIRRPRNPGGQPGAPTPSATISKQPRGKSRPSPARAEPVVAALPRTAKGGSA